MFKTKKRLFLKLFLQFFRHLAWPDPKSRQNAVCGGFIRNQMPDILGFMDESHEKAKVFLGSRIRKLRNMKGWTQQELGNQADVNYKFLGEIERGQQNPSFNTLVKIAAALEVELPEIFRFEQEVLDRNEIETRIKEILQTIPDDAIRQVLLMLKALYPIR